MLHADAPGLLAGAIVLGVVHGAEPGHGWPVAAAYAMDRPNAWISGLAASLLIGVGHLISSIAVVLAFFATANWLDLHSLQEPIVLADGVAIGGPLGLVAGTLLIALGVREYRHGHAHSIGDSNHDHAHAADDHAHAADDHVHAADEHDHRHDHDHHHDGHDHDPVDDNGNAADNGSAHDHGHADDGGHTGLSADSGLVGIAWAAFVLGFAHEEEFEILALCTGSTHCLELMLAYALAVIVAIVALTLALVAGYQRFERRVEAIAPHFPTISAAVLIVMGLGFLLGIL